ncbi:MAG TPA: glycosyltransferase, partial [Planctomycetota bacterium]|nr:glycosyltransferase [Planctomycetota bacterium]
MTTLSLVIPCYNEENTLRNIVERVLKLQSDDLQLEIIIVDDCSKDNSFQEAQKLQQEYP